MTAAEIRDTAEARGFTLVHDGGYYSLTMLGEDWLSGGDRMVFQTPENFPGALLETVRSSRPDLLLLSELDVRSDVLTPDEICGFAFTADKIEKRWLGLLAETAKHVVIEED